MLTRLVVDTSTGRNGDVHIRLDISPQFFSSNQRTPLPLGVDMVTYPRTQIFHGEQKTVAIAGPHIQVLDSKYAARTSLADIFLS